MYESLKRFSHVGLDWYVWLL